MGHAERDQQIAKRTIYSSKTKWAKSKGEPESLFPSPSILFSRETKRNETNSLDDWQKTKCVVIPRRFTVGHSSLVLTLSLSLFFFFFYFSTAPLLPRRARFLAHKARILDSRKKKKEEKERKKEEREKNRGKDATLDRASATRVAFSKSVMDGLMAPFGECVFAGKSLKLRSLFRPDAVNSRPFSCFSNRFLFFFSLLIHFERQFPPPPDFFNEMIHKSV